MQHNQIIEDVFAPSTFPNDMVDIPSTIFVYHLVADRAATLLPLIQSRTPSTMTQLLFHFLQFTLLIIEFPLWIVRVCVGSYFDMSLDGYIGELDKTVTFYYLLFTVYFVLFAPNECPLPTFDSLEVSVFDPSQIFIGMTPFSPSPHHFPDLRVRVCEDLFTDHVSVVITPPSDNFIEFVYQHPLWGRSQFPRLLSHLLKQPFLGFLRGFDEQLSTVFAEVEAEEIETFIDMSDLSLLLREF
jgi:hypothetical protein